MNYMKRFVILSALVAFSCSLSLVAQSKAAKSQETADGSETTEEVEEEEPKSTAYIVPQINLPYYDSEGATFLVVDSGPDEEEGRFSIGIQVFNRTYDKNISAEVYGWGGRFKEEWHLVNPIRMDRWNPTPKLYHSFYRGIDYTHYRYFAIKIIKPKDNKYKIVSDQKDQNLNFYIYDAGMNMSADTGTVSVYEASAQTYIVSGDVIKESENDSLFLTSKNRIQDLPVNLYVYSRTKKILVYYGIIKFDDWMDKKKIKKAVPLSPEEFKDGSEYNVKLKKDGLNLVLFVDD
ncbi:MAG: hypothetical protein K6G18_13425 [Treponema sp.]|nr:hypothetical protein [Treponema sp.]